MSNTRHASENGTFRQERFASSLQLERGLMANLVAKRCSVLEQPEDKELIWFLQLLSHQPGGMKKVAADLLARYPDRNASESMRKFGMRAGQIYNPDQVRTVRDEIGGGSFPLRGDVDFGRPGISALLDDSPERAARRREDARFYPTKYPASDFVKCCREAAGGVEKHLVSLCLDPATPVVNGAPWYFPTLVSTLREYQTEWIAGQQPAAVTEIGRRIFNALDYSAASGRLVVVDGLPRTGKSYAAAAWCALHPGRARYVQLDSSNGDTAFFRAIAKALGVSINLNSKSQELRQRIEDTLLSGDLLLVLDEAHYIWPNMIDSRSLPSRVNWIATALVNRGVPTALVTTPQFFKNQKAFEERTRWTSEQFVGRIGFYEKLPDSLSPDDLTAVASAMLPGADGYLIKGMVLYAQTSGKYLGGMDAIAARARFISRAAGRQRVESLDVKRAIHESVTPSDEALKAAIGSSDQPARRRVARVIAEPLQPDITASESVFPGGRQVKAAPLPSTRLMGVEHA